MAGIAISMLSGVAWPVREQWIDLEGERPIRVGSVALRATLRVSLNERRR